MNQNYEKFVRDYVEQEEKKTYCIEDPYQLIYPLIILGLILLGITTFTNILPTIVSNILSIIGMLLCSLIMIAFWDIYQKTLKRIQIEEITDISTESMA